MDQLSYLPLSAPSFTLLVIAFVFLLVLVQVGILRYAYLQIGLSPGAAMVVLLGSLIGSYFNIPVATLPERQIAAGQVVDFYGMQYVVPVLVQGPGTVIAVNVGGAVVPGVVSLFLLVRNRLWITGPLAVALVAAISHTLARPVPGVGIAVPVFVPALSTAVVALLLSRRHAAPLAYIGGSIGTLVGADLLNLGSVTGLGAPVASIGGAGTFDGIFMTGILAVLIASFTAPAPRPPVRMPWRRR
ncbi:MAG TPA: DUF1614 domain-containing protein [Acidisphaera sp.]|nr:DUF1614 domain-containing protein [Acidisphaera sp.]